MESAGPLRCAINDVVRYVPSCVYCFANDSVRDWEDLYRPEHVLFTPYRTATEQFLGPVIPRQCETVIFEDAYDSERDSFGREQLAEKGLKILPGTLGSAVQILAVMGVRRIVAVGIDGGGKHADREWRTRLRADHARYYDEIRYEFIRTAERLGIDVEFFIPREGETMSGKARIRITENTFARGVALMADTVAEIHPEDAAQIVAAGKGYYELLAAPAKSAPVEVSAVSPVSETTSRTPAVRELKKRDVKHPAK